MLSGQDYRLLLGLPDSVQLGSMRKHLESMIDKFIPELSDVMVVEVLGMEEMQDLHFQVRAKVFEETN